jgi:hypothetical protein
MDTAIDPHPVDIASISRRILDGERPFDVAYEVARGCKPWSFSTRLLFLCNVTDEFCKQAGKPVSQEVRDALRNGHYLGSGHVPEPRGGVPELPELPPLEVALLFAIGIARSQSR